MLSGVLGAKVGDGGTARERTEMKTIRLMNLWKIKNKPARRTVLIMAFPLLFVANIALAATGFVLFWWHNQSELFRSSAHYWRTDERITEQAPNVI